MDVSGRPARTRIGVKMSGVDKRGLCTVDVDLTTDASARDFQAEWVQKPTHTLIRHELDTRIHVTSGNTCILRLASTSTVGCSKGKAMIYPLVGHSLRLLRQKRTTPNKARALLQSRIQSMVCMIAIECSISFLNGRDICEDVYGGTSACTHIPYGGGCQASGCTSPNTIA